MTILKNKKIIILAVIGIISFLFYVKSRKGASVLDLNKIDYEQVDVGNIEKVIIANGIINPVNIISVGVQITGMVSDIYVDHNSVVKKGQLLAKLDTRLLKENLLEAKENLDNRKILFELQESNMKRGEELYKNGYISTAEYEEYKKNFAVVKYNYESAKSTYNRAKIELDYATIKSPVAGIIVSRKVDVGQTVTANVKVPDLFIIAEDLKKMQIEVAIAETDITSIKKGQKIVFSVDAYREKMFYGTVQNIRLGSEINQGVVMYTAIVKIDNDDLLLLPGMSAYVYIPVDFRNDVFRVKNTAFLFNPDNKIMQKLHIENIMESKEKREFLQKNENFTVLYILRNNNKIEPVIVEKGLSDSKYTEIKCKEIKKGDKIVSNYFLKK